MKAPVTVADWRALARRRLPRFVFDYVDGGAEDDFRRLRIRFERLAIIHEAFLSIACSVICWRQLRRLHSFVGGS